MLTEPFENTGENINQSVRFPQREVAKSQQITFHILICNDISVVSDLTDQSQLLQLFFQLILALGIALDPESGIQCMMCS